MSYHFENAALWWYGYHNFNFSANNLILLFEGMKLISFSTLWLFPTSKLLTGVNAQLVQNLIAVMSKEFLLSLTSKVKVNSNTLLFLFTEKRNFLLVQRPGFFLRLTDKKYVNHNKTYVTVFRNIKTYNWIKTQMINIIV